MSQAIVIRIAKTVKDNTDPNIYRPIALTSFICKTLERMINKRLVWFFETNNIFTNIQCGLRKNRSTIDQLVRLEAFILDAFVNKEHAASVFLYPRDRRSGGILFLSCLSFCNSILLYCPRLWNFNFANNFWTVSARALIFHMSIPFDKTFLLVLNLLTLTFDLFFKLTLIITY